MNVYISQLEIAYQQLIIEEQLTNSWLIKYFDRRARERECKCKCKKMKKKTREKHQNRKKVGNLKQDNIKKH